MRVRFPAGCLIASLLAVAAAPALEAPAAGSLEVKTADIDPSDIRFTPPPPPKPAPEVRIEKRTVVRKGTHTLTLGIGEPSTLPDIPTPSAREPMGDRPLPPVAAKRAFFLGLSATVYLGDRQPVSRLRWRDPETDDHLEAWCAWDWSLLPTIFELSGEDVTYSLLSAPQIVDLAKIPTGTERHPIPGIPALEADAFVITGGNPEAPAGARLLEATRRHIVANRNRLVEIRAARQRFRAEKMAWEAANPQRPRDHTIVLRPHRGSRYLEDRAGREQR